jgi:hypothetical protein
MKAIKAVVANDGASRLNMGANLPGLTGLVEHILYIHTMMD